MDLRVDLEARVRELATLNAIGDILNREPTFADAIGPALERLVELVGLTTGWVFVTAALRGDAHGGGFRLAASTGLPPALARDDRGPLCHGSCECQGMFGRGELDRGVNMVTCSRLETASGDRGGLEIHASVPLLGQGGPIGILNLTAPGDTRFDDATLAFLSAVGKQLGTAFDRSRLQLERTEEARYAAALEERQRLAQEMHDSVAQLLFAAELSLRVARAQTDAVARDRALLSAGDIVHGALSELRGLVEMLRPADLSCGLVTALGRLVNRTSGSVAVHLDVADPVANASVDEATAEALYRIAQEAVHNALRHAGAENVWLRLGVSGGRLRLTVDDDGAGLSPEAAAGLGLDGMRSRAQTLEGEFRIGNRPRGGVRVEVEVPWRTA